MPDGNAGTEGQEPNSSNASPESGSDRSIESFSSEAQDYIRRLRDESAKRRTENKDLTARLQALEDANKTEEQKREERASTAESRAASAEAKLLKFEVAAAANLPLKYAGRLQGSTKEELAADAKQLAEDLGLADGGSTGGSGFSGGVRRPVTAPKTMNDLIRQKAASRS